MKKCFISALFFLLMCFMLSSCTSKEAKEVINQIKALKTIEIDANSIKDLENISTSYDKLDEKEKKAIKNYEILENAYDSYYHAVAEDFDNKVVETSKDINSDSYDKLEALLSKYEEYNETIQNYITKKGVLINSLEKSKKIKVESVVETVLSYKNDETDSAMELIKQYGSIMNEEQKQKCLISFGQWESVNKAEEKIISRLKSPRSYYRYNCKVKEPMEKSDGTYHVYLMFEYGATNSFGGEVKETRLVVCIFRINTELLSVTFEDVAI
ncbi:MAG: hypothetical protein IJK89_12650 [Clostridia bacterium]|nr:hypothetical protein [Clostridia bacterium]